MVDWLISKIENGGRWVESHEFTVWCLIILLVIYWVAPPLFILAFVVAYFTLQYGPFVNTAAQEPIEDTQRRVFLR